MKRPLYAIILGLGLIFILGASCTTGRENRDGADDEGALPAALLDGAASPADGDYFVDVTKSLIRWHGEKVIGNSHDGTVRFNTGRLSFSGGKLTGGEFVADMRTIETDQDIATLERHLKSEDFFAVEANPEARFTITGVEDGDEPNTYRVTGDLNIRGKTQPVSFLAYAVADGESRLKSGGNLEIDRTKWDIKYASDKFFKDLGDTVIRDEIDLAVELEAQR